VPTVATATLLILAATGAAGEDGLRSRTFELTYRAEVRDIPAGARSLDLWIPVPRTDRHQVVHQLTIDAPGPVTLSQDDDGGNRYLHLRAEPPGAAPRVTLVIVATRSENAGSQEPLTDAQRRRDLAPEPLVPLGGPVRDLALEATRGAITDEQKARAIYATVTGLMTYDKSGTGWGRGDALYACAAKRGNCTDFHALVIGMARCVGIPARFAIGLPLPEARGSGTIPGYHCWAELHVAGRGWVPVDASEAAKDPARRDYFFGHHDENRLEFSRGRDLTLVPPQRGGPLNFFVYPYAEVDGRPHDAIDHKFSYADRDAEIRR
jgi:transglutaminase-like putative cysteine protease